MIFTLRKGFRIKKEKRGVDDLKEKLVLGKDVEMIKFIGKSLLWFFAKKKQCRIWSSFILIIKIEITGFKFLRKPDSSKSKVKVNLSRPTWSRGRANSLRSYWYLGLKRSWQKEIKTRHDESTNIKQIKRTWS